ncbi:hypothetical protein MCEMSEM23_01734 [Rhabdaerophilaceae bacterium]
MKILAPACYACPNLTRLSLIGLFLLACASTAFAQDSLHAPSEPRIVVKVQSSTTDCTCRMRGESLPLGSEVCLETPRGAALFKCQMDQNVTSWRPLARPCPLG